MEINFATSEDEAKEKYGKFENTDPFPEIPQALLNSADIHDYVRTTGMIYPFFPENLKPASYGIRLKGEYIFWLTPNERIHGWFDKLTEKDSDGDIVFTLKKNSIAFVQLESSFRFPSYLAARFDLKIRHIYQGILLGTGPLVDPGYEGNLYVPLHNLTNNDYKIKINSPVIWMEFTKLTPNAIWDKAYKSSNNRFGKYVPFTKARTKKTLSDYINDAYPNAPIISTIPGIIAEYDDRIKKSEDAVKSTVDSATKATNSFNRAVLIAMIGIFATIAFQMYNIQSKTVDYLQDYDSRLFDAHSELLEKQEGYIDLANKVVHLENQIKVLQEELKKVETNFPDKSKKSNNNAN